MPSWLPGGCRLVPYLASVPLWWFLILYQDHLLGVMEVLFQRPFVFGMRDLQVLQDLAERITAPQRLSAELAKINSGHELLGARAAADV